jgi:hypothetical protein
MNLLEHYILEIHEIIPGPEDAIIVIVTCDCYGRVEKIKHPTTRSQWDEDVKRGYFMA